MIGKEQMMVFNNMKNINGNWTQERLRSKIDNINTDIKSMVLDISEINKEINVLMQKKSQIKYAHSKKVKYKNLLLNFK